MYFRKYVQENIDDNNGLCDMPGSFPKSLDSNQMPKYSDLKVICEEIRIMLMGVHPVGISKIDVKINSKIDAKNDVRMEMTLLDGILPFQS